ncbi:hypothetical protein HYD56_02880 [Mycoplasmopsis bovis]|nr:hypothetical protein [Mycoplasmopsis bovis]QQH66646.1 hypothetical protein HYD56_02880 [Mycoplasmopsis bovis]
MSGRDGSKIHLTNRVKAKASNIEQLIKLYPKKYFGYKWLWEKYLKEIERFNWWQ